MFENSFKYFPRDILIQIRQYPENQKCCDCPSLDIDWGNINHGTLHCLECAGKHRGFGVQISFMRSIYMDTWSPFQVEMMKQGGNGQLKDYLMKAKVDNSSISAQYLSKAAETYRQNLKNRVNKIIRGEIPSEPYRKNKVTETKIHSINSPTKCDVNKDSKSIVKIQAVFEEGSMGLTLTRDPSNGSAVVTKLIVGGQAQLKGIRVGDVLIGIEDFEFENYKEILREVTSSPRPILLTFIRHHSHSAPHSPSDKSISHNHEFVNSSVGTPLSLPQFNHEGSNRQILPVTLKIVDKASPRLPHTSSKSPYRLPPLDIPTSDGTNIRSHPSSGYLWSARSTDRSTNSSGGGASNSRRSVDDVILNLLKSGNDRSSPMNSSVDPSPIDSISVSKSHTVLSMNDALHKEISALLDRDISNTNRSADAVVRNLSQSSSDLLQSITDILQSDESITNSSKKISIEIESNDSCRNPQTNDILANAINNSTILDHSNEVEITLDECASSSSSSSDDSPLNNESMSIKLSECGISMKNEVSPEPEPGIEILYDSEADEGVVQLQERFLKTGSIDGFVYLNDASTNLSKALENRKLDGISMKDLVSNYVSENTSEKIVKKDSNNSHDLIREEEYDSEDPDIITCLEVGMRIKAWHKGGRKWKSAIIVHIHKDNTLKIQYKDGEIESHVLLERIGLTSVTTISARDYWEGEEFRKREEEKSTDSYYELTRSMQLGNNRNFHDFETTDQHNNNEITTSISAALDITMDISYLPNLQMIQNDFRVTFSYSPLGLTIESSGTTIRVSKLVTEGQAARLGVFVHDALIGIENSWIDSLEKALEMLSTTTYPVTLVFRRQSSRSVISH